MGRSAVAKAKPSGGQRGWGKVLTRLLRNAALCCLVAVVAFLLFAGIRDKMLETRARLDAQRVAARQRQVRWRPPAHAWLSIPSCLAFGRPNSFILLLPFTVTHSNRRR